MIVLFTPSCRARFLRFCNASSASDVYCFNVSIGIYSAICMIRALSRCPLTFLYVRFTVYMLIR